MTFAEPYLQIGSKKLYGDDITNYHRIHMTSSSHCLNCGIVLRYNMMTSDHYPCLSCGYDGKLENIKEIIDYSI